MEITHGIHLIPRVRGANVYLVKHDDGITIIDTGLPGNADRIVSYVQSIGCRPSDVKTIIVTHADMDHAGSLARLKEQTNAKVAIHEADAPILSGEKERAQGVAGLLLRAIGAVLRFNRMKADVLLKDSDVIDGLTVIHTPGHTEGSICLHIPGRALFVGDALLTDDEYALSLPGRSMSMDLDQGKKSIKKISELKYSALLPGHGPPIKRDASAAAKKFVTHL